MSRQVYDFSNALIRCHAIYCVVANGKEKTPKQKYEYLQALLREENTKYDEMGEKKQGMANGLKKAAKIAGLEYELKQLEPKKHIDPISQGAKSYLKRLYGELKYGKQAANKSKGNKYTDKGKLAEKDSIALVNFLDNEQFVKNEIRLENEFISGELDMFKGESILNAERVDDVKTSWDWDTFSENIGGTLDPAYWWQEQGYFDLTGAREGYVHFCLVNTPESIIQEERFRLARKMDALTMETPEFLIEEALMMNNMLFDDIPAIERRVRFYVQRDDAAIELIHKTVPKCRDYLFELQEMHLTGFFTDKELPILETIEEI
jgi:hypothetical protein